MQAILNVAFPIFGVILAGYLAGRWRILVGEDAHRLDAMVRQEPERAYEDAFAQQWRGGAAT